MGCQWLVGLLSRDRLPMVSRVSLYDRGEIMIGSSDNSGGVVVGALVCREQNVAGSNLALCFDFFFFFLSLVEIFLSSYEPFQHGASIACCTRSKKRDSSE